MLFVIKPLNGVDNSKCQPIVRKLDNIKVAITPSVMTPLHQVTKQLLQQMQSYNDYSEAPDPHMLKSVILEEPESDVDRLEFIFKKLLSNGMLSKN